MKGAKKSFTNLQLPFEGPGGGEKLLQFIWQFGYFNKSNLTTTEGEPLSIVFPGTRNTNGGPDFSAAKIRIGETMFFGNVELHLRTSDWEKHRHNTDNQYRNVILHVVFQHDKNLHNTIPVVELQPRISTLLLDRYQALMHSESFIPCSGAVTDVKELVWVSWKERLLVERLSRKAAHILTLLEESQQHWEEVFWWLLARNFGMKVNSDAFEAIARSVPLNVLARHKTSIHQIEALLFGQAGLLKGDEEDEYPKLLHREYSFLKKKWSLQPVAVPLQFLRMRPGNFPTIRLAQLAVLIQGATHLFSKVLEAEELSDVQAFFAVTANDFWHYHYTFRQTSPFRKKSLGSASIDVLIVNTVIPVLFAYGLHHRSDRHKDKALQWLEKIAVEKNSLVSGFKNLGIKAATAYDSQALIELKNNYCTTRRCLQCAVGSYLLKREVVQATEPRQAQA